jgi:hypothetical protein
MELAPAVPFRSGGCGPKGARPRAAVVAALCLTIALGSCGCIPEFLKRRPVSKRTEETPPQPEFTGTGLKVSARFLDTRSEIEKRFKKFLPDSGVVPVEVIVRNDSDRPLKIHSANGLPLSPPFNGITVVVDGECYAPLSPLDVLTVLIGERKVLRYRKPGLFGIVAGVVAVQPLAAFFAHGELSVGRYYRSLVAHSIYPVRRSGVLEPITLGPGDERKGFLFILIPAGKNPYLGEGFPGSGEASCELRFRPSGPAYIDLDSLDICDVRMAGREVTSSSAVEGGVGEPAFFALRSAKRWRKGGLLVGHLDDVEEGKRESLAEVARFASRSAHIADASMLGAHAACAVNFRSKSRLYLVRLGAPPTLAGAVDLGRHIKGVRFTRSGLFVVTVDGVFRLFSPEDFEEIGSERLGPGIDCIYLDGGRLIVSKEKELSIYGTTGEDLLRLVDRISVPAAERRILAVSGGDVFVAHSSKRAGGDTLVVLDSSTFSERSRMVLPGSITYAGASGGVLLQIDEGTILWIRFIPAERSFRIEMAGHLPFQAGAISSMNDTLTVLGREGRIVKGDLTPREVTEFTVNVPLNHPHPRAVQ